MGNPISASYAAPGVQPGISLDWQLIPFSVSYLVYVAGGVTTSVTFDYTLDNINDPLITPVWVASAAITTTTAGSLTVPVQFVRLNVGSVSGGAVVLKLLQGTDVG